MKLATLCYVRRNGQTLMLHRIKKAQDMHAGKWNGLGGKLLPGETPEQCVIREVAEESGLNLINPRMCGFITFPAFDEIEDWYVFLFVARHFAGELIDSPEGRLAWIDDEQLPALNLWDGDRIFMQWLELDHFFSAQFRYHGGRLIDHQVLFYPPRDLPKIEAANATRTSHPPHEQQPDETICWCCGGPVVKRHCKIICQVCGFLRDCSDP
jgi:8-oxo-dGTP diphosphatase